jgi:microcystin-dependent protein
MAKTLDFVPKGTVFPFAGATAPAGYLICDGTTVSRTAYAGLFSVIGTSYGSGDGSTTFNLPDYRWMFLRGLGSNISVTGSGTASSNQATFTSHGFNRTGVKARLSSGTLSGLAATTDYWVIVVDANTLAFATSKANAIANTRTAISGANSAVIVQFEDPDAGSRAANTNGANSAASIGSAQVDALQNITGSIGWADTTGGLAPYIVPVGAFGVSGSNISRPARGSIGGSFPANMDFDASRIARTSNETRPSNVSINYIIKV